MPTALPPRELKLLSEVTSLPTAPFAENAVYAYILEWASTRPKLRAKFDQHGNLLLTIPGTKPRGRRLIMVAHTDHPGFVAEKMLDTRTLRAIFRGGVEASYVAGAKVKFILNGEEIAAKVLETVGEKYPHAATLRVARDIPPGTPGMFDVGHARVKGNRLFTRACDDLAGVASALAAIDRLHKKPAIATVGVLLTRGEEVGFVGSLAAIEDGSLLKKDDLVLSIETSSEQPYAPQGRGAIVRVGDKSSIFHSGFTRHLVTTAEAITKKTKITYQRALMPGGTCEATAFDAAGYTAGAVCVALGNYHNHDRAKQKIAPEYIDLSDWLGLVTLLEMTGRTTHDYSPDASPLHTRLKKLLDDHRDCLENPTNLSPAERGV